MRMQNYATLHVCMFVFAISTWGSSDANAVEPAQVDPIPPPQSPADASVGNPAQGRELFVRNGCADCHGYDGQGGNSSAGPRIAPNPLPWQAIAAFIRNPRGLDPPGYNVKSMQIMPPYTSKMVSDKDVQDIYAYLSSRPAPVDIKKIPTFKN